jgi:hypothetical protein
VRHGTKEKNHKYVIIVKNGTILASRTNRWMKMIRKDGKTVKKVNNDGVPGATRTPDQLLRRQPLYPAELQGRISYIKI